MFWGALSIILLSSPSPTPTTSSVSYATKEVFQKKIKRKKKTYVVFGADWCAPCQKLKKLLKQAEISHKIVFLNASESWVADILIEIQYTGIPYTVVYENGKPTGVIRYGLHQSLIFLIANIE
tara:strand:- start:370 stop:738 length:369 start_codon:yes stop_codon:yes gene_type:complete